MRLFGPCVPPASKARPLWRVDSVPVWRPPDAGGLDHFGGQLDVIAAVRRLYKGRYPYGPWRAVARGSGEGRRTGAMRSSKMCRPIRLHHLATCNVTSAATEHRPLFTRCDLGLRIQPNCRSRLSNQRRRTCVIERVGYHLCRGRRCGSALTRDVVPLRQPVQLVSTATKSLRNLPIKRGAAG